MTPTEPDPLTINNERVKLFANFVNAVGIGLIGFAILRPVTESLSNASSATIWWGGAGLVLHGLSHYILGYIRKETKP